jgi:hypothetical protein
MDEVCENKEIWISYIDDDGSVRDGFFILLEQTANYVKIKSGTNILILPFHKINKIKSRC